MQEMGCTVVIGGKVNIEDIPGIEEAAGDCGLDIYEKDDLIEVWRQTARVGEKIVYSGSTNYGNAEQLTVLLEELDIPYIHYSDADYEYDGTISAFDPSKPEGQQFTNGLCDHDGHPLIGLGALREAKAKGLDLDAIIARLEPMSTNALPPLEIIEPDYSTFMTLAQAETLKAGDRLRILVKGCGHVFDDKTGEEVERQFAAGEEVTVTSVRRYKGAQGLAVEIVAANEVVNVFDETDYKGKTFPFELIEAGPVGSAADAGINNYLDRHDKIVVAHE